VSYRPRRPRDERSSSPARSTSPPIAPAETVDYLMERSTSSADRRPTFITRPSGHARWTSRTSGPNRSPSTGAAPRRRHPRPPRQRRGRVPHRATIKPMRSPDSVHDANHIRLHQKSSVTDSSSRWIPARINSYCRNWVI